MPVPALPKIEGRFLSLALVAIGTAMLAGSAIATAQHVSPAQASQQQSDEQRLRAAFETLKPQRPGLVDAYVIVAGLDSDPVFGREAREAGRVLSRRFDAEGRTLVLAADEGDDSAHAAGTPQHLDLSLARIASLIDTKEDVLVLYTTSHGSPRAGINYKLTSGEAGIITPAQFAGWLTGHGFENRLIIIQACYSGQFVPALASPSTIVATAASAMRPSFGCTPGNDWTLFGHALINQAMRMPENFVRQFRRAFVMIDGWERKLGIERSSPQIAVGSESAKWLSALESRAPRTESRPVGSPPLELAE